MTVTRWNALAVCATAALLAARTPAVPARDGGGDEVRLQATLDATAADPGAFGEARFESRPDRRELRIDVDNVSATDALDVFLNGRFRGTIVLDEQGDGRLELNSQDGDIVPMLQEGDEIELVDANDGVTLILSGILQSTR
jgi:hypothetical protein